MRHKNNFSDKNELGKKILSGYIVTIMLLASFVMMIPTALAADGEANSLKTHMFDPFDPETEVTTFGDGNGIVVNVTFDITDYTGDDPSYKVKVVAQDSGEWVWVTVNDSDVLGPAPWNEINEPDDGKYWGAFIIGQDATANGSGGQPSYLHLENGEDAQIIENFDGDGNNVTTIITAEYVGTIRGWVKTNAEPPVAIDNALIQIDDGGGVIASVLTNATGDYIFNENISEGTYDVIASKQDVFEPIVADGISVMTGQTSWSNFSVPINTDITITGYVKDRINHSVLRNAEIMVYKMGYFEGYFNNGPYNPNEIGYFSINATGAGAGGFCIQIERNGYIGFINWSLVLSEGETKDLGVIYLEPLFETRGEENSCIRGNITADGAPKADADIMLLDTNFSHLLKFEEMDDIGSSTTSNDTGEYSFEITYRSTYRIIAFYEGYYADISDDVIIDDGDQIKWKDFSLQEAEPDTLNVTFDLSDLDDAVVTINRSIIASSRMFRFALDFDPEIGDSNQIISQTEIETYLEMIAQTGPSFKSFSGGDSEGGQGDGEKRPDFLEIPLELILDTYNFDEYAPGSFSGTFDELENTTVSSNSTIFYNASFSVTLDGPIQNLTDHEFNITTLFNNTVQLNLTVIFNPYYNIIDTSDEVNVTVTYIADNLTVITGAGDIDTPAYANITLTFNGSTVQLPIYEIPTWNIGDRWTFIQTHNDVPTEITYKVDGKQLRQWDQDRYTIGDENLSYVCYEFLQGDTLTYVTVSELDWLNLTGNAINYLINDVDFPLYDGKSWLTRTWWGENVTASIVDVSDLKITAYDTEVPFTCVKINYVNDTEVLVGQEWYSPRLKFFVNRSQYVDGVLDTEYNITSYSHSPFIDSLAIEPDDTDDDGLFNTLNAIAVINTSQYYDGPTSYNIEGPLYKESQHGPTEDITWMWNDTALRDLTASDQDITVTIAYSGTIINASGVDGPYTVWLELREQSEMGPGQTIDYISTETDEYLHTDFQSPALSITELSDYGNDTDEQTGYDYLTLNVTLNVLETGNYSINGNLHYVINRGGWNEWRWITNAWLGRTYLTAGTTPTLQLNFPGSDIYEQGYNSPYMLNIEIRNDDTFDLVIRNESLAQGSYAYTSFETPSIYFDRDWMSEVGDHDFINQSTYLTINLSIFVAEGTFSGGTGIYDLHGGLHFNSTDYFVTGMGQDITLSEGANIIPFNFNIGDIYDRNPSYIGNYTLHAGFAERVGSWSGPDIDNSEYITKDYNLSDPTSFPPPPVSISISSDQPSDDTNYLTIRGNVTVADGFDGIDYDFHGGLHYIQDMGEWENWIFITGMGETTSFVEGDNPFIINFSGGEIVASGYDGPYMVWLGIETTGSGEHERIADIEYETQEWHTTNFAAPCIRFNATNTTNFINGSDYLTVRTSLLVKTPGTYHIGGGIHWVQHMSGWDNWVFITGVGGEYLITENQNISFNFDQGRIRTALEANGYSGPLMVFLSIDNINNWQTINHIDYETQPYSAGDFSQAAVSVVSADPDINEDGDLVVTITYDATVSEEYRIHGGVHTEDWTFITGTWGEYSLEGGEDKIVNILFDGGQIYSSMQDGQYRIWLGIENITTGRMIANIDILTQGWNYTDFSAPDVQIVRASMTEGDADYMNTSGVIDYLTVNVSINTVAPGTYWIDGGLNYVEDEMWGWITGFGRQITLSEGSTIIPLNFNLGDIVASNKNGPYRVCIGIRNTTTWNDVDRYDYTTQSYDVDVLPDPPVYFEDMAEGNTTYAYVNGSYFTVNVTINVNESSFAGTYDLHGGISYDLTGDGWWQHITGTGTRVDLASDLNRIALNFNGGEIQEALSGYNDNLSVYIGLSNISTGMELAHVEYITKKYQQSNFPPPSMVITATGEYVNGSYLTVNLTIDVAEGYAGEYDVHGGVHWIDNSTGWDQWRYITGTGSAQQLSDDDTNYIALNFNGGDIYTTLDQEDYTGKLTVWVGIQNMTTWEQIAHAEYQTPGDYSKNSFNPPSLTITYLDAYNNNYEFLTVNVSINGSESTFGNNYDVHAGIHYREEGGWEWRYITGYGTSLLLTENITIPINFNGGSIRETGEDGPYDVWVGISAQGDWQDLAHDQNETGYFDHLDFALPAVTLNETAFTNYNNQTTNLTINVTLNASVAGEYFLEGCLHWKEGYNWRWITWAGTEINIITTDVEQQFALNFNGMDIARAQQDGWTGGTLIAWIAVRNTTTWQEISRVNEYTTESYTPSEFLASPVTFNDSVSITDGGISEPPYNSLKVNVSLNITTDSATSDYKIYANIYDAANNTFIASAIGTIDTQQHYINLYFNGTRIYKKHYNGAFEFRACIMDINYHFECDRMSSTTNSYNYTDFNPGIPEATIVGSYSNYTNGGNLVINVTVHVNTTHKQYELYGDLFDNTSTTYITNAKNTTYYNETDIDEFGNLVVPLVFDGSEITASGVAVPYKLAYLRLSIYNEEDHYWEELEVKINPYYTQGGS